MNSGRWRISAACEEVSEQIVGGRDIERSSCLLRSRRYSSWMAPINGRADVLEEYCVADVPKSYAKELDSGGVSATVWVQWERYISEEKRVRENPTSSSKGGHVVIDAFVRSEPFKADDAAVFHHY